MANDISTLLIVSALIAATGFVGLYSTNSPWKLTSVGRAMMTLAVSLILLCITSLLFNLLGPNYALRPLIRTVSWAALNLGLWWQLVNLIKAQNRVNRIPTRRLPQPRNGQETTREDEDKTPVA